MISARPLWVRPLPAPPAHPPLVAGGQVVVASHDSAYGTTGYAHLAAFDAATGEPRWARRFARSLALGLQPLETGRARLIAALSSSDLLAGGSRVLALDEAGETVWEWQAPLPSIAPPALWQGKVLFSTSDGSLLGLDVADGRERQRLRLQESCTATPLLAHDDTLVLGCADRSLLALAPGGTVRWQWWSRERGAAEGVVAGPDGGVYLTTRLGFAVALEAETGALRWHEAVGPAGKPLGVPAVGGGLLFVPARDGLYALRLASGQRAWQRETTRPVAGQPVYHDGALFVTAHDHTLAMLEAATGREIWQVKTERRIEVGPALAATSGAALRLYVADRDALSVFTPEAPDRAALAALAERLEGEESWQQAAALWARLERPRRYAIALGRHAQVFAEGGAPHATAGALWQAAAVAFAEAGEPAEAARCRLEAARLLLLPLISVDVEHEELVLNAWSRLQFIVRNQGFGRARRLVIRAEGDNFQGQLTATRQFSSIRPEQQRVDWLDVKPRAHGSAVPLRLTLSYAGEQGESHEQSETIYMPVSRSAGQQAQASRSIAVFGTAEALAGMDSSAFAQLHGSLMAGFGREELYTLAVELGIDYETLPREKGDFARELLLHLARHGRLGELARLGRERRGHLDWPGSM
jgi:outer membrane protein assembly factor BamB